MERDYYRRLGSGLISTVSIEKVLNNDTRNMPDVISSSDRRQGTRLVYANGPGLVVPYLSRTLKQKCMGMVWLARVSVHS